MYEFGTSFAGACGGVLLSTYTPTVRAHLIESYRIRHDVGGQRSIMTVWKAGIGRDNAVAGGGTQGVLHMDLYSSAMIISECTILLS